MEERLNNLIGKEYSYKGKNILIEKWKKVNSVYVVITKSRSYNFFLNEINIFLESLEEVKLNKKTILKTKEMEIIKENNEVNIDLNSILTEAIHKVKNDKDYIQQANAICNLVSQMINIKKIEIQYKNK